MMQYWLKLLTQIEEELTKQLLKLPQQLNQMQEVPVKPQLVTFCELCTGDDPTSFCTPANEEVNYMGNQQQRKATYQDNQGDPRGNNENYGKDWRKDAGPSNRKNPYQSSNQNPPQLDKTSKLEDTLNQFM